MILNSVQLAPTDRPLVVQRGDGQTATVTIVGSNALVNTNGVVTDTVFCTAAEVVSWNYPATGDEL